MSPAELLAAAQEAIKAADADVEGLRRATLLLVVPGAYNRHRLKLYGRVGPLGRVVSELEGRRILCEFDARAIVRWVEERTAKGLIQRLCHACLAPAPVDTCATCGSTDVGWVVLRGSQAKGAQVEAREGKGEEPCPSSLPVT